MSSPRLEAFLARLYVEEDFRNSFLNDPRNAALKFGLTPEEATRMSSADFVGLKMAAESFRSKREKRSRRGRAISLAGHYIERLFSR